MLETNEQKYTIYMHALNLYIHEQKFTRSKPIVSVNYWLIAHVQHAPATEALLHD